MPLRVADRVKEFTVSTGIGGVSFTGAYSGFQRFSDVLNSGDTTFYVIEENDIWEVGLGTYGSSNLERTTVLDSSSGGSKISLGGSGSVSIVYPASQAVFNDDFVYVSGKIVQTVGVSGVSVSKIGDVVHISAAPVQGVANYASGQAVQNESDIAYVSGISVAGGEVSSDQLNYVSGIAVYSSGQAIENESDIVAISGIAAYASGNVYSDDDTYVSGVAVYASGRAESAITEIPLSGLQFVKSGSSDEFRIGTTFVDPDGTEQTVRASDFNGGFLRLEVARFSPSVSANGQSRSWDQPVSQWSVTVDNPTDFTTNYVSGVKSPLTSVANGVVTTDVTLYTTSGPSVTPGGGIDWTQTFSTDADSPIYSSGTGLTGGSASATVSFLDKNQDTISETATISFNWSSASSSISFNNLTGNNFLQLYSSVGYNLTISNISDSSNTSTTITTGQGTLSNSSDDGTMTFTTAIHKDNNSGRTITATTDFTRPATVTGTEYTTQRVVSDSSISASFTYPSFRIFTSSTSNPPSRADIVDTNDFDSSTVTELGNQVKVLSQTVNNPESLAQCMWFGVRSSASQPTSFQTGSSASLLSDVTPTEATVNLEPDTSPAGYSAEEYKLYGITLQPGNTYVSIS